MDNIMFGAVPMFVAIGQIANHSYASLPTSDNTHTQLTSHMVGEYGPSHKACGGGGGGGGGGGYEGTYLL